MAALDQLALFEPDGWEAARLAANYRRDFLQAQDKADLWHACLCPGLRDACEQQAAAAYASWLVCAIFLDLEAELAR